MRPENNLHARLVPNDCNVVGQTHFHLLSIPGQISETATGNGAQVLFPRQRHPDRRDQLKVASVERPCQLDVFLNEGGKPRTFDGTKRVTFDVIKCLLFFDVFSHKARSIVEVGMF